MYDYISDLDAKEAFLSLSAILAESISPRFTESFFCRNASAIRRCNDILQTMRDIMPYQSGEATDVRVVVLSFSVLARNMSLPIQEAEAIFKYINSTNRDAVIREIGPLISATRPL